MKPITVIGLFFMIAGMLVMIYGGFSYTNKSNIAKLGSAELPVKDKQNVYIPFWLGITCFVSGGGILLARIKN